MKENTLDKGLKSFTNLSFLLLSFFLLPFTFAAEIYSRSEILIVDYILLTFMGIIVVIMLLIIWTVMSISYAYRKNYVNTVLYWTLKSGLDILLPLIVSLSVFLKYNKQYVRLFYVRINNIVVQSSDTKYKPEEILVLLPHCLQYSECNHRITNNIDNCRKCGKCPICDILRIKEDTGVIVAVATGGTAALNIVNKDKPKVILAVACERDLASGIADVRGIPVIAVLNGRPNGPCYNTIVDVSALREIIDNIVDRS